MPTLGTAYVVIKASLAPLKAGLAAAKAIVSKTMQTISAIVKKMASTVWVWTKRAALGLVAAYTYATYAAIKQEKAEFELAAALKATGQYSIETMKALKEQASAIQDATVYGDEYILTLQRMALNQGVSADKASDAAKAAIALYKAYGGGRGKPEIFLRYYLDALRGTAQSLDTYVGELRLANTEQERQAILAKKVAEGWDVVKAEAETAGGALKQLKNKLGDIAEAIGKPLLPQLTKTAKAITEWAKKNELRISEWSELFANRIAFVKDILKGIADYILKDWRVAFGKGFDFILVLFHRFSETVKAIMSEMWEEITTDIKRQLLNIGNFIKAFWATYEWGGGKKAIETAWKAVYEKPKMPLPGTISNEFIRDLMKKFTEIWSGVGDDLITAIPKEIKDEYKNALQKMAEADKIIREKYEKMRAAAGMPAGTAGIMGVGKGTIAEVPKPGFVGLKELWQQLAMGIATKKDKTSEDILKYTKEIAEESAETNRLIGQSEGGLSFV